MQAVVTNRLRGLLQNLPGLLTGLVLGCLCIVNLMQSAYALPNTRIVINIAARTLQLYHDGSVVHTYPIGVGKPAFRTPEGHYSVITMVENPTWEDPFNGPGGKRVKPGAKSPLGTRWIGFLQANGGEYGIHGTNAPGSVGTLASHGCIRMYVADAEELYNWVQLGTPVDVTYDVVFINAQGDDIHLAVYPDLFGVGKPTVEDLRNKILRQYPHADIDRDALVRALQMSNGQALTVAQMDEMPQFAAQPNEVLSVQSRILPKGKTKSVNPANK